MAILDAFDTDPAFSVSSLTQAINDTEYKPGRLGELGWFNEVGVNTTSVQVERKGKALQLIPSQPRGSDDKLIYSSEKRTLHTFSAVHLPQRTAILADEVQNLRAFGSETETEALQARVTPKLQAMRDDLDVTLEWQRIGAVKGQVLDSDGSTVLSDMFTGFNLTQSTADLLLTGTDLRNKIVAMKRTIEDELGVANIASYRVLCADDFFDAFVTNAEVEANFDRWQESAWLRDDVRGGFNYGGNVIWENYRGSVGGNDFIPSGKAYMVPEGVRGMFNMWFAPADYWETVNTNGLPYYSKQELMRFNKGVDIEAQSNPITVCSYPTAVIEITNQ